MRPWAGFAALAIAVLLILLTASEASDDGASLERERQWRRQVSSLRARSDSVQREYQRQVQRANQQERAARASELRRGRAVASSDSALARLDSAIRQAATLSDTLPVPVSTETDSASRPLARILLEVRQAWLSEREASSAVIAELWATVDAKNLALSHANDAIAGLQSTLAAQDSLVQVLTRRAHPSVWQRTIRTARVLAIGAAVGMLIPR